VGSIDQDKGSQFLALIMMNAWQVRKSIGLHSNQLLTVD